MKGLIYAEESSSGGWCTVELGLSVLRQPVNSRVKFSSGSCDGCGVWRTLRINGGGREELQLLSRKKFYLGAKRDRDDFRLYFGLLFGLRYIAQAFQNLVIVRWLFTRVYKDVSEHEGFDRIVIEHRKHTAPGPTPNQCETRCNLQGFGYVTVDELV